VFNQKNLAFFWLNRSKGRLLLLACFNSRQPCTRRPVLSAQGSRCSAGRANGILLQKKFGPAHLVFLNERIGACTASRPGFPNPPTVSAKIPITPELPF
jgi:hypothetical protein